MILEIADITSYKPDVYVLEGSIEKTEAGSLFGEGYDFPGSIQFKITAWKADGHITIKMTSIGTVILECARCLKPFEYIFNTEFMEDFVSVDSVQEREDPECLHNEDFINSYSDNKIDLHDFIRDNIILSIPMNAVCDENCLGICSVCGADLNKDSCACSITNLDPRWEKLKQLL